jgi:hypothetical protein
MKAVDFKGTLSVNGQIDVPPEIASRVPKGEEIQVMLLWGPTDDENEWRYAGRTRFESAYSPEDSIYEQLMHDSSTR